MPEKTGQFPHSFDIMGLSLLRLTPSKMKPASKPPKPIAKKKSPGIAGILTYVNQVQCRLQELVACEPFPAKQDTNNILDEIHHYITNVQIRLQNQGIRPEALAAPSLTAYNWLLFLDHPQNVLYHITALSQALKCAADQITKNGGRSITGSYRLSIQLYNTRFLYKGIRNFTHYKILLNEAFINAPPAIIEDLVLLALGNRDQLRQEQVRRYSAQAEFQRTFRELSGRKSRLRAPEGDHINLNEIFERVNWEYFKGRLSSPRLAWSSRKSYHKFGHYQINEDTLVISRALDDPSIPAYVLDFVMYHELLHKQLGVSKNNRRRQVHTSNFRTLEKRFAHYQKAQIFLIRMAQTE